MKVALKLSAVFLISILILSCVTKQESSAKYSVYVTDSQKFELLPPSAFEENMDRFQNITGHFQGKVHIFGAYIKSSQEEVAITFFNQLGGSVGDLLYTGDSLVANSHFTPQGTKFEYMMADFQFCYCQKELLTSSLEAASLRFDVLEQDGKEIRQIWSGDQLVIQVERTKNQTKLQNFLRQYSYDIQEGN
ncbi:MAG: DUF3261 domain-containing protein [Spirochaetia bacterium]|nr:DUF3261 domain-containing protein [Spirochaetia bacterium]